MKLKFPLHPTQFDFAYCIATKRKRQAGENPRAQRNTTCKRKLRGLVPCRPGVPPGVNPPLISSGPRKMSLGSVPVGPHRQALRRGAMSCHAMPCHATPPLVLGR